MEKRENIKIFLVQGIALLFFVALALGCASSENLARDVIIPASTGFKQGYEATGDGGTYIGVTRTQSDCQKLGLARGYKEVLWYSDTGNCFCR